jgi:hypothetical protein
LRYAVRADLADIRLADRVFAPHYAAPLVRTVACATPLRVGLGTTADMLAEIAAGEPFEVLELTHDCAWGVAPVQGLVGYISAKALA